MRIYVCMYDICIHRLYTQKNLNDICIHDIYTIRTYMYIRIVVYIHKYIHRPTCLSRVLHNNAFTRCVNS